MEAMLAGAANTRLGPPAAEAPLMANIQERLNYLRDGLGDASRDLDSLRTRLFGVAPSSGDAARAQSPQWHSAEAEIMGILDDLQAMALSINSAARILNNRI